MLLAISCSKQPLGTPQLVNAQMTENINRAAINTGHYIGERFGGGIIFWMTPDSMHGLIADTTDLGAFSWEEPSAYTQTNTTGTRIVWVNLTHEKLFWHKVRKVVMQHSNVKNRKGVDILTGFYRQRKIEQALSKKVSRRWLSEA